MLCLVSVAQNKMMESIDAGQRQEALGMDLRHESFAYSHATNAIGPGAGGVDRSQGQPRIPLQRSHSQNSSLRGRHSSSRGAGGPGGPAGIAQSRGGAQSLRLPHDTHQQLSGAGAAAALHSLGEQAHHQHSQRRAGSPVPDTA